MYITCMLCMQAAVAVWYNKLQQLINSFFWKSRFRDSTEIMILFIVYSVLVDVY